MTRGFLAAAVFVALLVPSCGRSGREIENPPERIVLILIDTLRRDHLSAYGSRTSTPHIDELAREGQLFSNAFSSFHQTTMSMASLFTGRAPSLESGAARERLDLTGRTWCGMLRFAEEGGQDDCIPELLPTLAGQLSSAGYWTVGVVTNLLLYRPGGYQRGFDRWVELGRSAPTAGEANLALRRVLEERPRDRLFLYIHYMDVHDYGRREQSYASAVDIADRGIGQLMDILRREGLLDGALIILTSDHGERLEERHFTKGRRGHNGNPSFDTLLKIPLIVSPAVFANPDAVVRSDDLHRMILEVAGAGPGPAPDLEQEELFLTELRYQTYRKGHWKSYRDRGTGQLHLVDLETDPGETRDVSTRYPEIAASHARRIDELAVLLGAGDAPPMQLSEEDRERLRALGYVRTIRLGGSTPAEQDAENAEASDDR